MSTYKNLKWARFVCHIVLCVCCASAIAGDLRLRQNQCDSKASYSPVTFAIGCELVGCCPGCAADASVDLVVIATGAKGRISFKESNIGALKELSLPDSAARWISNTVLEVEANSQVVLRNANRVGTEGRPPIVEPRIQLPADTGADGLVALDLIQTIGDTVIRHVNVAGERAASCSEKHAQDANVGKPDPVSMKPIRLPVAFWIVSEDAKIQSDVREKIATDACIAEKRLKNTGIGVDLDVQEIRSIKTIANRLNTDGTSCKSRHVYEGAGFSPGALNVYYVDLSSGQGCWCDNELILIDYETYDSTLWHELGHAMALVAHATPENACLLSNNIMGTDGLASYRSEVTYGQKFRMVLDERSAVNRLHRRLGQPQHRCPDYCSEQDPQQFYNCPVIEQMYP